MQAGSPRQAGIEREERCTGLGSRLIGQGEKLLFGLEIVVAERNIGDVAEAGFTVACWAGFSEPAGIPREEAITRADGGIETVLVTSRNAMANRLPVLLIIDLGARNISLCLPT